MKKLFMVILVTLFAACTGTNVKTPTFSFDGNIACIKDSAIATLDSSGGIVTLHSPAVTVTITRDADGHLVSVLNACININK